MASLGSKLGIGTGVILGALLLVCLLGYGQVFENVQSGDYLIVQSPIAGTMSVYTTPGVKLQKFGTIWIFPVQTPLYFSKHPDEGGQADQSVPVRFNDGATAFVTASTQFILPSNPDKLLEIQKRFRTHDGLTRDGMRQLVSEAIIRTAALMSAEQSYTTLRGEFPQMVWDQVRHGLYLTEEVQEVVKDPITGEQTVTNVVNIKRDEDGNALRKENWVSELGITIPHFTVKELDYEDKVDQQITEKQEALMQTVAAVARATKAIQDRKTAEEVGKKNVAEAKYIALQVKEKAVVAAEQKLAVAELDRQAAEQEALAIERIGKADATVRKALMESDGALALRLNAFVEVQRAYAEALGKNGHPLVPQLVFGSNGKGTSSANDLVSLLTAKAAKDLALDLNVSKTNSSN